MIGGSIKTKKKRVTKFKKSRKDKKMSKHSQTSLEYCETRESNKLVQGFYVPVKQQLNILIMKEPENELYRSIKRYGNKNPLSPKQLQCIIEDFKTKVISNKASNY